MAGEIPRRLSEIASLSQPTRLSSTSHIDFSGWVKLESEVASSNGILTFSYEGTYLAGEEVLIS